MLRNILSVVGGVVAGIVIIFIIEGLTHAMYPAPLDFKFKDPEALKEFKASLPVAASLMILFAYAVGSLIGGFIAALIASKMKLSKAVTAGGVLMGLGMLNMITLGHPLWMILFGIVIFVPCSYGGGYLALWLQTRRNIRK